MVENILVETPVNIGNHLFFCRLGVAGFKGFDDPSMVLMKQSGIIGDPGFVQSAKYQSLVE